MIILTLISLDYTYINNNRVPSSKDCAYSFSSPPYEYIQKHILPLVRNH